MSQEGVRVVGDGKLARLAPMSFNIRRLGNTRCNILAISTY
jgi:hypothetical protein